MRVLGGGGVAFVRDLERMAREGVSYFEVYRTALGPGSPALGGRSRIDRRIAESPLYRVSRDIATRVGIRQGLVLAPEHEQERATAPANSSMMSVAQAAELMGISRAAVYKAVNRGAIKSMRYGNVTVVERASVIAYRATRPLERRARPPRRRAMAPGRLARASHDAATAH